MADDNKNVFGESEKTDRLIVVDDASGLVDKSNKFVSFLMVARKFGYNCLYIFHIIYPSPPQSPPPTAKKKETINNIEIDFITDENFQYLPGSVEQSSVLKIIFANCSRETVSYVPKNEKSD